MPTVPSGILYFMVWKYGLYALLLLVITQTFFFFDLLDQNPIIGIVAISIISLIPVSWFEYGDMCLFEQWNIDKERTNCDRMAKAFAYVYCCILWPKHVV